MCSSDLFEPQRDVWERQVRQALEKALAQAQPAPAAAPAGLTAFSLLDDEVVENKIIASRLSLAAIDKSGAELNDLNVRIQFLEQTPDYGLEGRCSIRLSYGHVSGCWSE